MGCWKPEACQKIHLADSGVRASELVRLLVQGWQPTNRSLLVRSGKERKDRVTFVGPTTTLRYSQLAARDLQEAHREASPLERLGLDLLHLHRAPRGRRR